MAKEGSERSGGGGSGTRGSSTQGASTTNGLRARREVSSVSVGGKHASRKLVGGTLYVGKSRGVVGTDDQGRVTGEEAGGEGDEGGRDLISDKHVRRKLGAGKTYRDTARSTSTPTYNVVAASRAT